MTMVKKLLDKITLLLIGFLIALVIIFIIIKNIVPYGIFRGSKGTDELSKYLVSYLGDSYTFITKREFSNTDSYMFVINKVDNESLRLLSSALKDCKVDKNTSICVLNQDSPAEVILVFYNYKKEEQNTVLTDGFYHLSISHKLHIDDWFSYYDCFGRINTLEIDQDLYNRSLEERIDWYEIWPGLEDVIVDE